MRNEKQNYPNSTLPENSIGSTAEVLEIFSKFLNSIPEKTGIDIEEITGGEDAIKILNETITINKFILENNPDCVKLLNSEGKVVFMNTNGLCSLELEDFEKVKNKYWWELWDVENRPIVKKAIKQALLGEKSQFQASSTTPKGNVKWWDVVIMPMNIDSPLIVERKILAVSRDITELKNQQLKESELLTRFQNLVLVAPVAICILNGSNHKVAEANEFFLELIEKSPAFISRPFFEALPELIAQGIKGILDKVYKTGVPFYGNERHIILSRNSKKDSGFFNFVFQPVLEKDARVSHVIIVISEVTEQVNARKKLENQAALVQSLLMTAPGFICTMTGPEHTYLLVNERYQKLFGKRQLKGKTILQALPELHGQKLALLLDQVYNTGEPYVGNEVSAIVARDIGLEPEERFFNFSYQPMFNESGKTYSILVFGYEVTEEVKARNIKINEQLIREEELEKAVLERTAELTQLNESLIRKNKELESFAYISSHDLQEPLRKIQTFAGRLIETEGEKFSDKGREYMQKMHHATGRMQQLITDILSYSTLNKPGYVVKQASFSELIETAKSQLETLIESKSARINLKSDFKVNVINSQFTLLISHLISNSLKFSPSDTIPEIIISSNILNREETGLDLPPSRFYRLIEFKDNGIGFDSQYESRIFEVFQRLHTEFEYKGTGIGLALCKRIMENHGGYIKAKGNKDEGAIFSLYLPIDSSEVIASKLQTK